MLVLLLGMVVFFFMASGAVLFTACALIPTARPYGLSVALWCLVFGASVAGIVLLGVVLLFGAATALQHGGASAPSVGASAKIFWIWGSITVVVSIAVASLASWLHQALIHRMTFALFRVYATLVSAGIGCVLGLGTASWLWSRHFRASLAWEIIVLLLFCGGFGLWGHRFAGELRGQAPESFTWISKEDFEGRV